MARSFSEQEKEHIRNHLMELCRQSWARYGYKKTSVDELCKKAGISKGAFYIFYESKEALFCEVICSVQGRICDTASRMIEERRDRFGAAEALKFIYREYDKHNFLYEADSEDFTILMNKLSEEQAGKLAESDDRSRRLFSDNPYLKCKVDADMAASVIYSLIMNIRNKEILPYSHEETFDFMVDHLVGSLFD